jgi:hypothetical protein
LGLLPVINTYARRAFRHLNPADREEATAEAVALAFREFVRLRVRAKDPAGFPTVLARFSTLAVHNGRRVGSAMACRDVMSVARRKAGTRVTSYGEDATTEDRATTDLLPSDTRGRVPDVVALRVDFPAWLRRLSPTRRRTALLLAAGFGTGEVAAGTGMSDGRVSQLRRELAADWHRFHNANSQPPI